MKRLLLTLKPIIFALSAVVIVHGQSPDNGSPRKKDKDLDAPAGFTFGEHMASVNLKVSTEKGGIKTGDVRYLEDVDKRTTRFFLLSAHNHKREMITISGAISAI